MNAEVKITRRDMFEAIKETFKTGSCKYAPEDVIAFCDKELAALDHKSEKARERAAAKRAAPDELLAAVESQLTDEYQTIADVVAAVLPSNPDVTVGQVQYRLNALVKAGKAEKTQVTIPATETTKTRKVQAYKVCN